MSKLTDKAKSISFAEVDNPPLAQSVPIERPRTAMGAITASIAMGRGIEAENRDLHAKLERLADSKLVELIDPKHIKPSRFANRHELSFAGEEFARLKAEISSAGLNVQPIKVRRVGQGADGHDEFEIAFGHRRHRACLELGIPVATIVETLTDTQLFAEMERENRERQNLSPWEQGTMYLKALDEGLYSSLRRLAEGLSVDISLVSKSVSLARLPETVIAAFQSPLDIQFRWAAPLAEAMQKDPVGTLARARNVATARGDLNAAGVFARLIGLPDSVLNGSTPKALTISRAGKVAGKLTADSKGRVVVRFEAGAFPDSKRKALVKAIEDFLKS